MLFDRSFLAEAHKHSDFHHAEIMNSKLCGCFYCQEVFKPSDIEEWLEDDFGKDRTALCPKCDIDAVIGSDSGFPVHNKDFLEAMYQRYFS